MKKLLASLLALTLVFGSAVSTGGIAVLNDTAITASAETQYGNDFEYEVDEYGALWIRDYVGNDKEVVIPNNINGSKVVQLISLGNNNVITSVTIPSTVEYIDPVAAFHSCSNLNTINVDDDNLAYSSVDGVLYDKAQKFLVNCPTAKDKVTVPKGVTNIGDYAFNTCTNLEAISLQEGLVCIGDQSFFHCEKLKSINLPNGVEYIGKGAFSQCGNLKNITLPDSIKGINDEAFFQCAGLTEIKLPENLIDIGSLAFADCSLKQITIPKSVNNIYDKALGYYMPIGLSSEYEKIPGFKIYCYSGTAGEQYAIDNGFDYELLDDTNSNSDTNSETNSSENGGNSQNSSDGNVTVSSESSSENSSSKTSGSSSAANKTNNSTNTNPNTGVAAGLSLAALGFGAVVVTKRRK